MKELIIEVIRSYPGEDGYAEGDLRLLADRTTLPIPVHICTGRIGALTRLFFSDGALRGVLALDMNVTDLFYAMSVLRSGEEAGLDKVYLDWIMSPRIFPELVPDTKKCPCRGGRASSGVS
jgi:hypothetical protein